MLWSSRWLLILIGALFIGGCTTKSVPVVDKSIESSTRSVPRVVVSLSPLAWIVSEIAGDQVELIPLMPQGADPAVWSPDEAALDALASADLIILNSSNLEKWAQLISLPIVKTLEVARECQDQWLRYPKVVTHSHGPEGERSFEGVDGHTWLDPELLRLGATAIKNRLVRLVPEQRTLFEERFLEVDGILVGLTERLIEITSGVMGMFLEGSPYWGYPCARAGLTLNRIELNPDAGLDEKTRELLASIRGGSSPSIYLWPSPPSDEFRQELWEQLRIESAVWPPAHSLGTDYARYPEIQNQALTNLTVALLCFTRRP